MHYTNLLPITFDPPVLVVNHEGYEESLQSPIENLQPLRFSSGGNYYAFPTKLGSISLPNPTQLSPADIPEATRSIILRILSQVLSTEGQVRPEAKGIRFLPSQERKARLFGRPDSIFFDVHHDTQAPSFRLLVLPQGGEPLLSPLQKIYGIATFLQGMNLTNGHGTIFKVASPEVIQSIQILTKPSKHFRPNGYVRHENAARGLMETGPYSFEEFRNRSLRLLIIGPNSKRSPLDNYVADLIDGIQEPGPEAEAWSQPWKNIFRFPDVKYDVIWYRNNDLLAALPHIQTAVKQAIDLELPFDFAIFHCDTDHPHTEIEAKLSAALLTYHVPSQCILSTQLEFEGHQRAHFLRDLALKLYAQAGGTPWLLSQQNTISHEVFLGVGQTALDNGVVGFLTMFSSHGRYLLGNSDWAASEAEWIQTLKSQIVQQIQYAQHKDSWIGRSHVNIIFHLGIPLSPEEKQNIHNELEQAFGGQYTLTISFLYFNDHSAYRIWDTNNQASKSPTHQFLPSRGAVLRLGTHQALIQLASPHSPDPSPMLLEHYAVEDGLEINDLITQAFHLAHFSWASVLDSHLPATLEYGELIARRVAAFRKAGLIESLRPALTHLNRIPWYL